MAGKNRKLTDYYLCRLYDEYPFFVHELWHYRGFDRYHKLTDIEYEMLEWTANGPRWRGVAAPRGLGKTMLLSSTFPLWKLYRNRNHVNIILSANKDLAGEIVGTMLNDIKRTPFLVHLSPKHVYPGKRVKPLAGVAKPKEQMLAFRVAGAQVYSTPSVVAYGADSAITGKHGHTIVVDDLEIEENSRSPARRARIERRVEGIPNLLFSDAIDGSYQSEVFMAFTYLQDFETIYESMARHPNKDRRLHVRTYPILAPSPGMRFIGLSPLIMKKLHDGELRAGDPIFPHRFTPDVIEMRRSGSDFARQNMLQVEVAQSITRPLQVTDMIVHDCPFRDKVDYPVVWGDRDQDTDSTDIRDMQACDPRGGFLRRAAFAGPRKIDYERVLCYVDPSGAGEDTTGVAIVGVAGGTFYVLHSLGMEGIGFSDEVIDEIVTLARAANATTIVIESNYSAGMYTEAVKRKVEQLSIPTGGRLPATKWTKEIPMLPYGWSCSVCDDRAKTRKEHRIIGALSAPLSQHRLVVDRRALAIAPTDIRKSLQYQIANITTERNCLGEYGQIDALAGALAWLAKDYAKDAIPIQHETRMDSMKAQWESWMQYQAEIKKSHGIQAPRRTTMPYGSTGLKL